MFLSSRRVKWETWVFLLYKIRWNKPKSLTCPRTWRDSSTWPLLFLCLFSLSDVVRRHPRLCWRWQELFRSYWISESLWRAVKWVTYSFKATSGCASTRRRSWPTCCRSNRWTDSVRATMTHMCDMIHGGKICDQLLLRLRRRDATHEPDNSHVCFPAATNRKAPRRSGGGYSTFESSAHPWPGRCSPRSGRRRRSGCGWSPRQTLRAPSAWEEEKKSQCGGTRKRSGCLVLTQVAQS